MNKKIIKIIIVAFSLITPAHAKGIFGELIGGAIGGAVGSSIGKDSSKQSLTSEEMEKVLIKMTNEINKRLPMAVNEYKRLDSSTSGPGLQYTYYYTMVKDASNSVSRTDIANYIQQEEQEVKSQFCTNPKTLFFSKNGVTVNYSYRLSDGVYIGEFNVTPRDCGY